METPAPGPSLGERPPLVASLIATVLGAGLSPVAPGTCGTLAAVPLAFLLARLGDGAFFLATIVVVIVGSIAADAYIARTGVDDDQRIVVDEVAGYLVTLSLVPKSPADLLGAFVLFRLFDIWKPQPVRWIDRHVAGGFGVVADDLAAGVYAALSLLLLHRFLFPLFGAAAVAGAGS